MKYSSAADCSNHWLQNSTAYKNRSFKNKCKYVTHYNFFVYKNHSLCIKIKITAREKGNNITFFASEGFFFSPRCKSSIVFTY